MHIYSYVYTKLLNSDKDSHMISGLFFKGCWKPWAASLGVVLGWMITHSWIRIFLAEVAPPGGCQTAAVLSEDVKGRVGRAV